MFEELLRRLAIALDDAGIPYMVFGGQAVLLYGEPRLTRDIDITLGVDPNHPAPVLRLVDELNLTILTDNPERFVEETFVLPVLDRTANTRIDFVFSLSGFEREAIDRARAMRIAGTNVRFVSLEDLIIMKVIAGRPRDLEDVVSVIRKNPSFDCAHVERWLRAFDSELDSHHWRVFEHLTAGG